jgi:HD-GYP domain-containing protein (c-di-GMP phosphodiesterase class II)
MTSDRPYHVAIDVPQAMLELRHHGGSQFDPDVVAAFCRVVTAHVMEATPQRVRDEVFA